MKNLIKISAALLLMFAITSFKSHSVPKTGGDDIIGLWEPSSGKARVKINKIGNKYFGKIVWLKEPIDPKTKKAKVDKNNPNEKLTSVPLRGSRILKDFIYSGENEWSKGTIYDPESGSTYSCVINKKKDVLNIRGYVGIKALGRTDTWKRIKLKKKKK